MLCCRAVNAVLCRGGFQEPEIGLEVDLVSTVLMHILERLAPSEAAERTERQVVERSEFYDGFPHPASARFLGPMLA